MNPVGFKLQRYAGQFNLHITSYFSLFVSSGQDIFLDLLSVVQNFNLKSGKEESGNLIGTKRFMNYQDQTIVYPGVQNNPTRAFAGQLN